MGWGTYYKYDGYLSRIGKDSLFDKKEELEKINEMYWRELLAYMAATPPEYTKDCEGSEYPYPEFLAMKIRDIREELEDNISLITRIDDCVEAMSEDPESVKEG